MAYTVSVAELMLNAVALEFILNVDELLYEALAPLKTRRLITLLQPIPVARARSCGGVDVGHIPVRPVADCIDRRLGCSDQTGYLRIR